MSHIIFDFSTNAVPKIIQQFEAAEDFIKIAMFQIHHNDIFNILNRKLDEGVKVEILTLPYDSINLDVKTEVEARFERLKQNGAVLHFCKWNVGDPSRTTTAVGRWYAFHGKFIVTDKSAIFLSANFTQNPELDAMIVYVGNETKINEFKEKFDQLLRLFIIRDRAFDGNIRRKIMERVQDDSIFELPSDIGEEHRDHWIKHYPISLCPSPSSIEEKLYITPFDCKGRDFIINLIDQATTFVYISTESFTDIDFSNFLKNTAINRNLDIRLISGTTSMDFTDRVNEMFRDLLSQNIKIRTTDEDLHAKLIITDKHLMVSSMNLNKINLGFYKTKRFWHENTETLYVCEDEQTIDYAKERYIQLFDSFYDVRKKLSEKLESMVGHIFTKTFNLRSRKEVKSLFAKFILQRQINLKRMIIKIGKITYQIMLRYDRRTVEKEDFISALILYYLSERKHDYDQLKEKMDELDSNINLRTILSRMRSDNLIEKENDYYKINLDELIM